MDRKAAAHREGGGVLSPPSRWRPAQRRRTNLNTRIKGVDTIQRRAADGPEGGCTYKGEGRTFVA